MSVATQHRSKRCADCGHKVIYKTEEKAKHILSQLQGKKSYKPRRPNNYNRKYVHILHVYKCPWGDGYHIGHKH